MGFDPVFAVDLDLVDHRLEVVVADGRWASFPLPGLSVAAFYQQLLDTSRRSACRPPSTSRPVRPGRPHAVRRGRAPRVLRPGHGDPLLGGAGPGGAGARGVRRRSYAKTSPVHHFWHTFDLAVTRFSDRRVEQPAGVDPVTREAYSHEVVSAGFWFGDDQVPEPAFYSYTAPEPAGLVEEPLRPAAARWIDSRGAHLALLPYEDVRTATDPRAVVLDFLESAYVAGARRAGWDLDALRCPTAPEYR
jgi:hypothetical protein